jgi:hypothetical protein
LSEEEEEEEKKIREHKQCVHTDKTNKQKQQ